MRAWSPVSKRRGILSFDLSNQTWRPLQAPSTDGNSLVNGKTLDRNKKFERVLSVPSAVRNTNRVLHAFFGSSTMSEAGVIPRTASVVRMVALAASSRFGAGQNTSSALASLPAH